MKKPGSTEVGRSSFGWYIHMLARMIESGMQERLEPHGITISEFTCLMALLEKEGVTQTELGSVTGAPEYSTSRTIEKLVQGGLVKRQAHPTSRRAHQIYFTKKGKTLGVQLPEIIVANNDKVLVALVKSDRAKLESLLGQIVEHHSHIGS